MYAMRESAGCNERNRWQKNTLARNLMTLQGRAGVEGIEQTKYIHD